MLFDSNAFTTILSSFFGLLNLWNAYSSQTDIARREVLTSEVRGLIEQICLENNVKGLALAVVHPGSQHEYLQWGQATESGDGVTQDSLFQLASVSKAFLASSIGILIDDFASGRNVTALPEGVDKLDWTTKIQALLPDTEWQLEDRWTTEKANLRDILGHVTGMPRHDFSYGPQDSTLDVIRRLHYLRPAYELRQRWSYNNMMYVIGMHILETYSGQSYPSFARKRIFLPLGMESTTFEISKAVETGRMTDGWTDSGRLLPHCFSDEVGSGMNAGPGGIISSAIDMTKWMELLLRRGVQVHDGQENIILPLDTYNTMTTAHSVAHNDDIPLLGYGLGWFRDSFLDHSIVWHTGDVPGYSTRVSFAPDDNIGFILLANTDSASGSMKKIHNILLKQAFSVRLNNSALGDDEKASPTNVEEITESAETSVNLDAFAGTYYNPGYGSFTLCASGIPSESSNSSAYCQQVLYDFAKVDSATPTIVPSSANYRRQQLLGAWERLWSSHIRITPISKLKAASVGYEHTFNFTPVQLYPDGYGANKTPFEQHHKLGRVVFVFDDDDGVVKGLGLFTSEEDETLGRMREKSGRADGIENRADAWFVRV